MKKTLIILFMSLFLVGCSKNNKIGISLEGNATTGYEWTYSISNEEILEETKNEYITKDTGLVGASGVYNFEFKGLKEGTTNITFIYSRSWETEEPLYVLIYEVKVNNKKEIISYEATGTYLEENLPKAIIK